MFKRLIAICAFAALPVAANATTIDFDAADSTSSQVVGFGGFYSEDGYTFAVTYTGPGEGPAIFNTLCTGYGGTDGCNGDGDLVPGVQGENDVSGNILIIQENRGSAPTPNDEAGAGSITFTLVTGPAFQLLGFSAIDDGQFSLFDNSSNLLGMIDNGNGAANDNVTGMISGLVSPIFNVGDSFTIGYSGSGGVDSLVLAAVPLPAGAVLLLGALGGLGAIRRRANRAA
ncbi:hypothetical protein A8B78_09885 [Jannaschia sp. EhC01]|nr:hypothetical protein A8B78_09885 [Jannaschia sp. EhC01]